MEEKITKLGIECVPDPNDEGMHCTATVQGPPTSLMQAYAQLSIHFYRSLEENLGKPLTRGLYAFIQNNVLRAVGVDIENEATKAAEDIVKRKRKEDLKEAFKDIIGKTFTEDDIKKEDAE